MIHRGGGEWSADVYDARDALVWLTGSLNATTWATVQVLGLGTAVLVPLTLFAGRTIDAEALVRRPRDATDNATPSGAAAASGALVSYAALMGSGRHREAAERALAGVAPLVTGFARFAGWWAAVAEAALAGPLEVAVVGPLDDRATRALHRVALLSPAPGAVVALGDPSTGPVVVPLLRERPLVEGRPAAYVCRAFTCKRPLTEPGALARSLGANAGLIDVTQ